MGVIKVITYCFFENLLQVCQREGNIGGITPSVLSTKHLKPCPIPTDQDIYLQLKHTFSSGLGFSVGIFCIHVNLRNAILIN